MADLESFSVAPGGQQQAACALHPQRVAVATCSRCGDFACTECVRVGTGGAHLCASCARHAAGDVPWERREELGTARAFFLTAREIMLRPGRFFAQRPVTDSIWPAVLFGWLSSVPGVVVQILLSPLLAQQQAAQLEQTRGALPPGMLPMMELMASPWYGAATGLGALALYPLSMCLVAGLWWLCLLPFKGAPRGFASLVRVLCYVNGWNLGMVVLTPLTALLGAAGLGAFVGLLMLPFILVLYVWAGIAIWKSQDVDGWKPAAAAALQWVLLFTCSCCAGIALALTMATNARGGF